MGRDLAEYIGVPLEMVETTWGNSVMDLQGGKIDIMFALSNNPERAKSVDFTEAMMDNVFTVITSKDREVKNWEELNKPEIRVTVDLGSTQDLFARKTLPNCTLVALKGADETVIALQSGRADAIVQVALMSVVTAHKLGDKFKVLFRSRWIASQRRLVYAKTKRANSATTSMFGLKAPGGRQGQ